MDLEKNNSQIRQKLREYEGLLKEYLSIRQSSDQSRAGVLEQRLQEEKTEIQSLQTSRRDKFVGTFNSFQLGMYIRDIGPADLIAIIRRWRRDRSELPTGYGVPLYDGPFFEERRYIEDAVPHLEEALRQANVPVPPEEPQPPQDPTSSVAAQVQKKLNAIAALEGQRDEELKKAPEEHHGYIKRAYGKAIDELKQQL